MNNKGFTLVELIATIALLAVIAVVSFVSITGIISSSKVSDCENLVRNIKSATKEYVSDNRYGSIDTNPSARDLINSKYLSGPIYDPFNNSVDITDDVTIDITLKSDNTVDTITVKGSSGEVNCNSGQW